MSGRITRFVMEDVRCFAGRQEVEVKPLTIIVGENSTGKSTTLGCFQVLANCFSFRGMKEGTLDFNTEPYSMGSFNEIVSRKRPAEKKFKLGFKFKNREIKELIVTFTEKEQSAEPMFECIKLKIKDSELCFTQQTTQKINKEIPFVLNPENTDVSKKIFHVICNFEMIYHPLYYFDYFVRSFYPKKDNPSKEEKALIESIRKSGHTIRQFHFDFPEVFSFAPVRSRPKRTYDPIKEFEDPEGSDIPMLFMRMKSSQKEQWEKLQGQLTNFGQESGLFEKIEIKRHGKSMSDPFQIQIKVRGPRSNIMDIGYGTSQVLPILVKIFGDESPDFLLLQQPEVHLHPRGQAELASLFARVASRSKSSGNAERRRSLVVETHSDYIIDRTRIEIQRGTISPKDVSLVYMEPKGSHVEIHNIGFDNEGNLIGAPRSYRDFFLKETDKFLGFED